MTKASITIVPPAITDVTFFVEGTAPYISNRKNKEAIKRWREETEGKKVRQPKPKLTPEEIADKGIYWLENGSGEKVECIPGAAFKQAMITGARFVHGLTMTYCCGPFQVMEELIPMKYIAKNLREDVVNEPPGPRGSPAIRYRCEFIDWKCEINIRFDADAISVEQLGNLLNKAGFHVGVGDWRKEKKGDFGTFVVMAAR